MEYLAMIVQSVFLAWISIYTGNKAYVRTKNSKLFEKKEIFYSDVLKNLRELTDILSLLFTHKEADSPVMLKKIFEDPQYGYSYQFIKIGDNMRQTMRDNQLLYKRREFYDLFRQTDIYIQNIGKMIGQPKDMTLEKIKDEIEKANVMIDSVREYFINDLNMIK